MAHDALSCYQTYLPALLDRVEAGAWQPIETAPKDGTAVLLNCPTFYFGAGVYLGWWDGSLFQVCTEGASEHPYSDDGATHWRPLPEAPALQQKADTP